MSKVIMHMSLDLRGVLKNRLGKKSLKGFFIKEDGSECTHQEAENYILDCIEKGWRVIPLGECPNFDYQEGCQCYKQHPNN